MRICAAGIASLVLAGCTSGTAPESRISTVAAMAPRGWSASPQARRGIDHQWIQRFGDPRLTRLVREGLRGNLDLQGTAERVRRAEAVARRAGAALQPRLDAALRGSRSEQKFVGFPFGGGGIPSSISESYGASLDVAWELDVWGKTRAGQSAALADAAARGFDLAAARTSLAAQIAKAWFAFAESSEQVTLSIDEIEIRRATSDAVGERFALALVDDGGTAGQLRLVQTELASAEANLAFWQGERERARRQLELLVGRYPSGSLDAAGRLPDALPDAPPAGLPSELLLRRPDVLAAERNFAAAGRRVRVARRARYPSLRLTGSLGTTTEELKNVLRSEFGVWSLGANLAQPILDGGALREDVRIAESDERAALRTLQQTVLSAFGEVEQALVADRYLAARLAHLDRAALLAVDAARSTADDYAGGSGDILTVLAAQAQRVQVLSQRKNVRRLRFDTRVNLHLALGGDFRLRGK